MNHKGDWTYAVSGEEEKHPRTCFKWLFQTFFQFLPRSLGR